MCFQGRTDVRSGQQPVVFLRQQARLEADLLDLRQAEVDFLPQTLKKRQIRAFIPDQRT